MAGNSLEFFQTWSDRMGHAKAAAPDAVKGFGSLFASVMKEGALSLREKELIALAIAMTLRCDPCTNLHVRKALEAGATRQQVVDAASVVVVMQGGPAYTYLPRIVEALDAVENLKAR